MHILWMQVNIKAPAWDGIQRGTRYGGLSSRTQTILFRWGAHHCQQSHLVWSAAFVAMSHGYSIRPDNFITTIHLFELYIKINLPAKLYGLLLQSLPSKKFRWRTRVKQCEHDPATLCYCLTSMQSGNKILLGVDSSLILKYIHL